MANRPSPRTRSPVGIEKAPTGVVGLDAITGGGLPRGGTTLILGGPGSGKTVLALQILVNGARNWREPGIFVAFEENARQIVRNAASFGWDLPGLQRRRLFFLDARTGPDEMSGGDFDLAGLLEAVRTQARRMGARRVVFDALDVLLTRLDDPARERREIQRLHEWMSATGFTGIITGKADAGAHASRGSDLQFMTDCTIMLDHRAVARQSLRELRVQKYRGSGFSENAAPMVIGGRGVEVAGLRSDQEPAAVSRQRVTTGVPRLDTMLGGGYYRGSSVLITGAPGTAKSTLCGAYAVAACARGERVLYMSFDEAAGEHVRNLGSVGVDLARHLKSGLLRIVAARIEATGLERQLVQVQTLLAEHRARHVIFDPLSALFRAGPDAAVTTAAERILWQLKRAGVTTLSTSMLGGNEARLEGTPLEISTVADTWIHLSYTAQAGERNRALTIVKSRGMRHSNQVRELLLDDTGVGLADVYAAGGEVMLGTLRWQQEERERLEQKRAAGEVRRRTREIKLMEAELNARIQAIRRELELKRLELETMTVEVDQRRREAGWMRTGTRRLRHADFDQKSAGRPARLAP